MLVAAAGCEITEVVIPEGEDVLVVEAVLRANAESQHILLHRTLNGTTMEGAPGARVAVLTPQREEVLFIEDRSRSCLRWDEPDAEEENGIEVQATCYSFPPTPEPWVVPGESYELRIETADGRRVRGRTQVPGAFSFRSPAALRDPVVGPSVCTVPPDTVFPLVWSSSPGAWIYLAEMRMYGLRGALADLGIADLPDSLRLTGISVSESDTTLVLPSQMGLFQRGRLPAPLLRELQRGFPAGVRAEMTIAALDRNLVNALRGGTFNPSGDLRISSVVGEGVGVFGSLVPLTLSFQVQAGEGEVRCTGGSR